MAFIVMNSPGESVWSNGSGTLIFIRASLASANSLGGRMATFKTRQQCAFGTLAKAAEEKG
jgi:hypothetical protein